MVPVKLLIAGTVVIVAMSGCSKKKDAGDKDFSSTTPATTTPAASQDIFDEFYKEDTASRKTPEPQVAEPIVRGPAEAPEFVENGRFVVQVSTVRSRVLADDITAKLSAKGYPAYVAEVESPTPSLTGTYYRIRIGGFTGISKARSFGENTLVAEGYEYWVDNRSNDNVGLQGGDMGGGDTYYTSEPAQTYQPSEPAETYAPAPTPAPAAPVSEPAPAAEYTPAQEYTPESAAQEFNAPPEPAAAPAPAPSPADANTEWGNDGW